jgi:galactitol-specific phosphotransferase system IIB component
MEQPIITNIISDSKLSLESDTEVKKELKKFLKNSKINHKLEIMKQGNLKKAHIYCIINRLSGQVSGNLLEHRIKIQNNMIKNKASLCIGDLQHNETNFEIKTSLGGKNHNKFNYVQIRFNHICEYILTAYYITNNNIDTLGELFIFKLNKMDMKKIILKYGGYAHGTKKKLGKITQDELDNIMNDKEYAFRPKYGGKSWCHLLQFRIDENSI